LPVQSRVSIGFNTVSNDVKIRDNRVIRFKHFCVLGGSGSLISGNHWFQDDNTPAGLREGGIIICSSNCKSIVTGNYIDNNFIEWTNEYDSEPAQTVGYSFGGLTITGNTFTTANVAPWFSWIVIKPYGAGHFIDGFSVVSNVFKAIDGNIDRVEKVDTTFADLDFGRMRRITFDGNVYTAINQPVYNPVTIAHTQATESNDWVVDSGTFLPFQGRVRGVTAVVPEGRLSSVTNATVYEFPYATPGHGPTKRQMRLGFATACKGAVRVTMRMDQPL
jgi:hypothetical protein